MGLEGMVTLNYLRAEIENDNKDKNIIYAIEEPETAQHPNNQKAFMKSLIISKDGHIILLIYLMLNGNEEINLLIEIIIIHNYQ